MSCPAFNPLRTFFLLIIIFFCLRANAQKIILIGSDSINTQFYSLDISSGNCSATLLHVSDCNYQQDGALYSDAIFKDTLYFTTTSGGLYRTVLGNPSSCMKIASGIVSVVLTVDKNGLLYYISEDDNLVRYDPHNNITDSLGILNYHPSGDLVFYNDTLLLAASEGFINVNIANPPQSTVYIPTPGNNFYGLVNISTGCNQNKIFGFQPSDSNYSSTLVQLNVITKSVGSTFCTLPFVVQDAASITETGSYAGVNVDSIQRPPCSGTETSTSIQVYASSASADSFIYTLNNIISNSTGLFTGLTNGVYKIHIQTSEGCFTDTTIHINLSEKISVNIFTKTDTCSLQNGIISITQTSGLTPLQFSLDNNNFTATPSFTMIDSGFHLLKIRDTDYCVLDTNVRVNFFTSLLPVSVINKSPCNNLGGVINIHLANLSEPLTIGFEGKNYNVADTISFTNLPAAKYVFFVTNSAGCSAQYGDTLINTILNGNIFSEHDTIVCTGSLITLSAGINNATYIWDNNSISETRVVDTSGKYWVTVNVNGCIASDTTNINFIAGPLFFLPKDTTLCINDELILNAFYEGSTYVWQDGSTSSTFIVNKAGLYSVQATNICGTSIDSVNVQYQKCDCSFYVPSAFTPNHDGVNDLFRPIRRCDDNNFTNYEFSIYNRWGQIIFNSSNASEGWDGNFKNKMQPLGGYVWMLHYKDRLTGKIVRANGTVILIH